MTQDTPGRIRARRFLNDKILSARVQVAVDKKLGRSTPKAIVDLAHLNVPKGPIEFRVKESPAEMAVSGDQTVMVPRRSAAKEHRATA